MTNIQAISYLKVAIYNLKKNKIKITYENILSEMWWLFDVYTEKGIEEKSGELSVV